MHSITPNSFDKNMRISLFDNKSGHNCYFVLSGWSCRALEERNAQKMAPVRHQSSYSRARHPNIRRTATTASSESAASLLPSPVRFSNSFRCVCY